MVTTSYARSSARTSRRPMVAREAPGGYPRRSAPRGGRHRRRPVEPSPQAAQGGTAPAPSVGEVTARVRAVADELRTLARYEPSADAVSDLDDCLAALRRLDGAARAVEARVVAAARRADAAGQAGVSDTAAYVRDRLGLSGREAKRRSELARDLEDLGRTADALADGELGVEQAAAVGRAARAGHLGDAEETEAQLLDVAGAATPERLREEIRRREQAADGESARRAENRAYSRRRASCTRREDGMWEVYALLDPESGERVAAALRARSMPDTAGTPLERRRRPEQRMADALVELADAALRSGDRVVGGVRPHVAITVPIEVLDTDEPRAVGVTETRGVLSPQAVQRLLCDAAVSRILTRSDAAVLEVGRATRVWTSSQRRAIVVRDGGCRGPGCDRPPAWCDIHHVRFWSDGGRTDVDNGLLLCRHHHRLLHEGRWTVVHDATSGRALFTPPGASSAGRAVETWPHPSVPGVGARRPSLTRAVGTGAAVPDRASPVSLLDDAPAEPAGARS